MNQKTPTKALNQPFGVKFFSKKLKNDVFQAKITY